MRAQEKTRVQQPSQEYCKDQIQCHIDFMEQEVDSIEQQIAKLIASNEKWKKIAEILISMPGIGKTTAAVALIAEFPELGILDEKLIAALAGVAPFNRQSGASKGSASIRGGRASIRKLLYMAAVVAIRRNPTFRTFYERLRNERGKCFKVAIVAVMRKMIIALNAMIRSGEHWHPDHLEQCKAKANGQSNLSIDLAATS